MSKVKVGMVDFIDYEQTEPRQRTTAVSSGIYRLSWQRLALSVVMSTVCVRCHGNGICTLSWQRLCSHCLGNCTYVFCSNGILTLQKRCLRCFRQVLNFLGSWSALLYLRAFSYAVRLILVKVQFDPVAK